jgi:hypothetical protein
MCYAIYGSSVCAQPINTYEPLFQDGVDPETVIGNMPCGSFVPFGTS